MKSSAVIFVIHCWLLTVTPAIAAAENAAKSTPVSILSSAIVGIGMGIDGRSSISNQVRSGSNFHFEAVKNLGLYFTLGLRTVAEGSINSAIPFQRMASDLIWGIRPSENTRASLGFGKFSESGQNLDESKYRIRGRHFSVQIQHVIHQMRRLKILSSLSWGISQHNLPPAVIGSSRSDSRSAGAQKSNGFGIAFEFPFDTSSDSSLSRN